MHRAYAARRMGLAGLIHRGSSDAELPGGGPGGKDSHRLHLANDGAVRLAFLGEPWHSAESWFLIDKFLMTSPALDSSLGHFPDLPFITKCEFILSSLSY